MRLLQNYESLAALPKGLPQRWCHFPRHRGWGWGSWQNLAMGNMSLYIYICHAYIYIYIDVIIHEYKFTYTHTPPKFNSSPPKSYHLKGKGSFSNHHCWEVMLNFRGVYRILVYICPCFSIHHKVDWNWAISTLESARKLIYKNKHNILIRGSKGPSHLFLTRWRGPSYKIVGCHTYYIGSTQR